MDDPQDRRLLRQRQQRLQYHPYWLDEGQQRLQYHPYWLDEEQIFLYRPEMYVHFFAARPGQINVLPIRYLWQRDLSTNNVLQILQQAFDIEIDPAVAQTLHHKWCDLNFSDP